MAKEKSNGTLEAPSKLSMIQLLQQFTEAARHETIETVTEYSKETQKIILPEGMSKKTASEDLMNQYNNEEQTQNFTMTLEGWEWKDGLRAFRNVLETKFGWIKGVTTWWSTPTEIDIVVDIKKGKSISEKGYMGKVAFPSYDNAQGQVGVNDSGEVFVVVTAKRKFSAKITEFFGEVRAYLQANSIYRGKSVVVTLTSAMGKPTLDLQVTELKANDKIFLNYEEEMMVQNFIIDQLGEEGKRCFLLTGPYGNGKTETALRVGIQAVAKKISFFYVKDASIFSRVLSFARNYEPCVIFLEDIDEISAGEQRDAKMNDILNTLDGVQTKGRAIVVMFTTNHEKRINKALRRPGRIDLIIKFGNPEATTAQKIYAAHLKGIEGAEEINYEEVLSIISDAPGAVIAEIATRAKKLAVRHGSITTDLLGAAIASMKHQIEFMQEDLENADVVKKSFETVREFNKGNAQFGTPPQA